MTHCWPASCGWHRWWIGSLGWPARHTLPCYRPVGRWVVLALWWVLKGCISLGCKNLYLWSWSCNQIYKIPWCLNIKWVIFDVLEQIPLLLFHLYLAAINLNTNEWVCLLLLMYCCNSWSQMLMMYSLTLVRYFSLLWYALTSCTDGEQWIVYTPCKSSLFMLPIEIWYTLYFSVQWTHL